MPPRTVPLTAIDRDYFTSIAQATWKYFDAFVDADHHHLPPDNVQLEQSAWVAHRTSPTNIGMGLLATLAAHDFGFIDTETLITRVDSTLTTVEGLERFEGHLLNWYDTSTLAPMPPAYLSTVDSGNLAGALITLSSGLRILAADPSEVAAATDQGRRLEELATRATAFADGMNFGFLYNRTTLFSIGYRLADATARADSTRRSTICSPRRPVRDFVAIAKGDVPEMHWFHLGRLITGIHGAPVLLSWSATLFEYLMPLLIMRSYPDTLLDESCRMVVRRQREYATSRGTPWGISESAYTAVDRNGNYQYKAFGIPGLGLKRGLGDELVVAPYATALAATIDPARSADNLRRLADAGAYGDYGFFDAIDYTKREVPATAEHADGVVVRAFFAHHEGMTLVALANAVFGDRMVKRFHADPRIQATDAVAVVCRARARDRTWPLAMRGLPHAGVPLRRYRPPHTRIRIRIPATQYIASVTPPRRLEQLPGVRSRGQRRFHVLLNGSQFLYRRLRAEPLFPTFTAPAARRTTPRCSFL